MEKLVYTVKEVAEILNIGMNKAYELIHQKEFPCKNLGRKILIPRKPFEDWVNKLEFSQVR